MCCVLLLHVADQSGPTRPSPDFARRAERSRAETFWPGPKSPDPGVRAGDQFGSFLRGSLKKVFTSFSESRNHPCRDFHGLSAPFCHFRFHIFAFTFLHGKERNHTSGRLKKKKHRAGPGPFGPGPPGPGRVDPSEPGQARLGRTAQNRLWAHSGGKPVQVIL